MKDSLLIVGSVAYDCIETPLDSADFILGGSASYAALAASFFSSVKIVGVVGNDFKESDISRLAARNIDISALTFDTQKPTFFWRGKYHENFSSRETLDVRLNAFEGYMPKLGESAKKAKYVLLGNISPEIQESVLGDMENPEFVILDTMDLWIQTANAKLRELIRRTDLLILNDSEAKMLSENRNIICAGDALLEMGIIPIVNENDSVSYKEIESEDRLFGDNDMLSAVVAVLCRARHLVILSDIDGFYDHDPRLYPNAKLIEQIDTIDDSVYALAGGAGSRRGTGGMRTKLQAAALATSQGTDTIVTNGKHPEALYDIVKGLHAGTLFPGKI
mgnify:CR=1 FL=1